MINPYQDGSKTPSPEICETNQGSEFALSQSNTVQEFEYVMSATTFPTLLLLIVNKRKKHTKKNQAFGQREPLSSTESKCKSA